jgi:hypothetical protein
MRTPRTITGGLVKVRANTRYPARKNPPVQPRDKEIHH